MVSNGLVLFVLLVGAAMSLPTSGLLWLYRRAVLAAMRRTSMARVSGTPVGPTINARAPTAFELQLLEPSSARPTHTDGERIFMQVERRPWVNAAVYGAAGLATSVVDMVAYIGEAQVAFTPLRVLVVLWALAWPIVLTTMLLVARGRRDQLRILGVYLAIMALLALSQADQWWQVPFLWLVTSVPPTLYQLMFLHRKLRAVGPLVIVFTLVAVLGTQLAASLLGSPSGLGFARVVLAWLTATQLFVLVLVMGFAAFGVVGWWVLGWLARRYDAKQVTDQSLTLDALWLTFVVYHALSFSATGLGWTALGLAGFGLYRVVVWRGFAIAGPGAAATANHRLLLLRVFGSTSRSERLMDRVGARWRYAGSIQLIAGTDLAADALEPHELLDFVRGRLKNRYIVDRDSIERQLRTIDARPDYDARFRMAEFFCFEDTWRLTLSRLAATSAAVLMDLRAFSPANQGCIFELRELVNRVPMERVVLVVDGTTDADFLQQVLHEAGQELPADSPNARSSPVQVAACRLDRDEAASSRLVLSRLAAAAAS